MSFFRLPRSALVSLNGGASARSERLAHSIESDEHYILIIIDGLGSEFLRKPLAIV